MRETRFYIAWLGYGLRVPRAVPRTEDVLRYVSQQRSSTKDNDSHGRTSGATPASSLPSSQLVNRAVVLTLKYFDGAPQTSSPGIDAETMAQISSPRGYGEYLEGYKFREALKEAATFSSVASTLQTQSLKVAKTDMDRTASIRTCLSRSALLLLSL